MQIQDLMARLAASEEIRSPNRVVFSSIDSTNRVGKQIASAYRRYAEEIPGALLIALEQTRGRGRLGNHWLSPKGGIYVSMLLPRIQHESLIKLPMQVATVLCGQLDRHLDLGCRVKWPNDLIVGGRKIGGILIESVHMGQSVAAIIGFGINYSCDLPELMGMATSILDESRSDPGYAEILIRMVAALETITVVEESMNQVVEKYADWSVHEIDSELLCRTARGTIRGRFLGFDSRGFLRLATESGERLVSAGEIVEGESRHES